MANRTVAFLAILLTALLLVPEGAHFFELPAKIGMDRDTYFAVQQIYSGWSFFGIVMLAAFGANVALAVLLRRDPTALAFAVIAAVAVVANIAIFFIWTYPANQATANWTRPTEDWQMLRSVWEYSHAVNALVSLIGLCSATLAALTANG
jgi:hypothetical protein